MKVLIINQAYWPDVVATAQHMTDWAQYLVAAGHEVTVIASRSIYGQAGAVLPKAETHVGVRIIRVGANRLGKRGFFSRVVDFGTFHLLCLARALVLPKQTVVVCLTTPPFIGIVGMLLKWLRGSKYVQYEMDVYPDVAIALGTIRERSLLSRFLLALHRRLLKSADRVVVLGRCMRDRLRAQGALPEKLQLVTPWADETEIRPVPRDSNSFRQQYGLQDKFVVMYSGNLGLGHDIETIARSIEQLAADQDQEVRFVFVGGGKRMAEIAAALKYVAPGPLFLEYQPRDRLADTLSAADVHLITQAPGTTGLIVPSKLYGILAAGRPVLYIGPADTEVAMTIEEHALGELIPVGDYQALTTAIRSSQNADRSGLEERMRALLQHTGSKRICCGQLTAMLEQFASGPRR